ncbi:hypothetical protein K456DRAFT_1146065 [Colletotrichum gloeosporioides 23]|nr:hypothetical protein K456DRAFT_1146065 [Colletotrichum gloeosporioides 23]
MLSTMITMSGTLIGVGIRHFPGLESLLAMYGNVFEVAVFGIYLDPSSLTSFEVPILQFLRYIIH